MPLFQTAPVVVIGGVRITCLTREQWVDALIEDHRAMRPNRLARVVSSANGHIISLFARDPVLRSKLEQMDAIDCDGMPLVWLSRLLSKHPVPERVATTDFFHDAAQAAEQNGLSFYFLGAEEGENQRAIANVQRLYPELRIAGGNHGFFRKEEEVDLIARIRDAGTDVLWVGMGVPREQAFLIRNRHRFKGITWAKSCGGLFNFLSGKNSRAPLWMQRVGLEWAHRVSLEPRRLARRYAITNADALYQILVDSLRKRRGAEVLKTLEGRENSAGSISASVVPGAEADRGLAAEENELVLRSRVP